MEDDGYELLDDTGMNVWAPPGAFPVQAPRTMNVWAPSGPATPAVYPYTHNPPATPQAVPPFVPTPTIPSFSPPLAPQATNPYLASDRHPESSQPSKRSRTKEVEDQQESERTHEAFDRSLVRVIAQDDPQARVQLQRLTEQLDLARRANSDLQTQHATMANQLETERRANSDLASQHATTVEQLRALQEQGNQIGRGRDAMEEDLDTGDIARERDELLLQLQNLQGELRSKNHQCSTLQQERDALQQNISNTEPQPDRTTAEEALRTELANVRGTLITAYAERDSLRRDLEVSRASKPIITEMPVAPSGVLNGTTSQAKLITDLRQERQQDSDRIRRLEIQLAESQSLYDDLEAELFEQREETLAGIANQKHLEEKKVFQERIFILEQEAKREGKRREPSASESRFASTHFSTRKNLIAASKRRSRFNVNPRSGRPSIQNTLFPPSQESSDEEVINMDIDNDFPRHGGTQFPPQSSVPVYPANHAPYETGQYPVADRGIHARPLSHIYPENPSQRPAQSFYSANRGTIPPLPTQAYGAIPPTQQYQPTQPFHSGNRGIPPPPTQAYPTHVSGSKGPFNYAGPGILPPPPTQFYSANPTQPSQQAEMFPFSNGGTHPPPPARPHTANVPPQPQAAQHYVVARPQPPLQTFPVPPEYPRPPNTMPTSPPLAPPNSHRKLAAKNQSSNATASYTSGRGAYDHNHISNGTAGPSYTSYTSGEFEGPYGRGWNLGSTPVEPKLVEERVKTAVDEALDARLGNRDSRTSYKPFDGPGPAFRRKRSDSHNLMMSRSRKLMDTLMGNPDSKQFVEIMGPDLFVDGEIAERFENNQGPGPTLQPFLIYLDGEGSRWNDVLGDLFQQYFIHQYPNMANRDDIKKHFTDRIRTFKNTAARLVPREGETVDECDERLMGELARSAQTNRIRSRTFNLRTARINDSEQYAKVHQDGDALVTAQVCTELSFHGHSSDESDDEGNRIVRSKHWRNKSLLNRLASADRNHSQYTVTGALKPGGLPKPRIRRIDGPVSTRKIPKSQPLNFYAPEVLTAMSELEFRQLEAKPAFHFNGESDPVDHSIYEEFHQQRRRR